MQNRIYAKRPADIMIVDDAPENLDMLVEIFRHSSFNLRPVTGAGAALRAARNKPPDLILLDIHMPEMDGLTLCGQLKAADEFKDIPVIFISGGTGPGEVKKAFAAGGADYFAKPFQREEVLARVETQLELRFLRAELKSYKKKFGAIG